jgi:hypothetical protein
MINLYPQRTPKLDELPFAIAIKIAEKNSEVNRRQTWDI